MKNDSGLGRLGRSSRSLRGRSGLGRHALGNRLFRDDHALTAAVTTGATAADNLTAATALAGNLTAATALGDSLTATALGDSLFTGAATVLPQQAVAPLAATMALVMPGQQAPVATTTVAAVTGNRTVVTADQGDGDERE